ncbi:ATP-binding protein, partial [Amycolatopsis sp. NPDC005961]|uniref:ATP-binding protein n=1 Tax=Amycolatopsis sp. NPDC005961 TaxID=3156720 RepID=UPI0033ED4C13
MDEPPGPFRCHGVQAEPQALRRLRHDLMAWVLSAGVDEGRAQDIVLASYEALANVADHAYDATGSGVVDLDAAVYPDRIEVVIGDHGQWRTPVVDPRPVSARGQHRHRRRRRRAAALRRLARPRRPVRAHRRVP